MLDIQYVVYYTVYMIHIVMPIYRKDYIKGARKDNLLGLNWYTQASNTFRKKGKTTTGTAQVKKAIHEVVLANKDLILAGAGDWNPDHGHGFHVSYKVYAKRLGTDGHNVRSCMEKMVLDAIEEAGIIDNDKYVYSTDSKFYLDRKNPRIEITITHLLEDHNYIVS